MAAPSGAEHGAARGGRAPRAEAGVAMPGVRPHLGASRRVALPEVRGVWGEESSFFCGLSDFFACFRLYSAYGASGNQEPPRTCFPTAT